MNSKKSEIKTEFNFLTFMADWKPPADVSVAGMVSRNNQKLSQVNETRNSKEFFDTSESPIMKSEVEAKQENKKEPMDDVFMEQNKDLLNVKTHSEEDDPLPISDEPKVQEMVGVQKRKSKKSCHCDICGKDFLNHENMKRHIDGVHLNKKDHKCSKCGKGFSQKKDLNRHLKNKICSIYKHLLCELCGKSFGKKITLYRHIRFIHEGLKHSQAYMRAIRIHRPVEVDVHTLHNPTCTYNNNKD